MRIEGFVALLRKELATAITNQVFIVLFGVPIVIATFLGVAFASDRQAAAGVALVLPADDRADALSEAIGRFQSLRVVGTYRDLASAVAPTREGRAVAVIDLSRARMGPTGPEGSISLTLDETRAVLSEVVRTTVTAWISGGTDQGPASLTVHLLRGVSPRDAAVPLWLLIAALSVSMGSVPLLLTEEKEHRTLDALLVTPLGAPAIVVAKALLGTATILVMSVLIVGLNGTAIADPPLLAAALTAGAASLVCLGLFVGSLAPNQASASPAASVLLLLLVLPVILGELGTTLGLGQILPTYHLNALLSAAIFGGPTIAEAAPRLTFLSAFAVVSALAALWSLGRDR